MLNDSQKSLLNDIEINQYLDEDSIKLVQINKIAA